MKDELKKATDVSTRKLERDLTNAKEELQSFKAKAEDLEQKLVRVRNVRTWLMLIESNALTA